MEPKKNPSCDIHRYRSVLLGIGLITSLSIVITAFKWTAQISHDYVRHEDHLLSDLNYDVPITDHVYETKTNTKPVRIPIEIIEVKNDEGQSPYEPIIEVTEIEQPVDFNPSPIEFPIEEVNNGPIIFAEVMPEPINGYEDFYKTLSRLIKYPGKAQQREVEGKVFVEFVVDEQGNLSKMKVIKGIGSGCDEEAMRVLNLTHWKPGKQRGRPVKVRMILPVHFRIN